MSRLLILAGCISGAVSVAAGAFGAHTLREVLSPDMLNVFETAARYQMYHAIALMVFGYGASRHGNHLARLLHRGGFLFIAGTLLFSGSLYAYALSGAVWIAALTPVGGVLFIAGWLTPLGALKREKNSARAASQRQHL